MKNQSDENILSVKFQKDFIPSPVFNIVKSKSQTKFTLAKHYSKQQLKFNLHQTSDRMYRPTHE